MPNQINVLHPYNVRGTWVFDDPAKGLEREPFVMGVPEMIEVLTMGIPSAEKGFCLLFSSDPFPGADTVLRLKKEDLGGAWYSMEDPVSLVGWLCPAMFKYFDKVPEKIYVKAEKLERKAS